MRALSWLLLLASLKFAVCGVWMLYQGSWLMGAGGCCLLGCAWQFRSASRDVWEMELRIRRLASRERSARRAALQAEGEWE